MSTEFSRRSLFAGAGAAVGAAVTAAAMNTVSVTPGSIANVIGDQIEPFYGVHQAGIRTTHQAHGVFASYNLVPSWTALQLAGVLHVATGEAARLTGGKPGLSDTDPMFAGNPARLTVTFGVGPAVFDNRELSSRRPAGFVELPAFAIDKLQDTWSGGDLLIHVGGDDPLTVSHALRHMSRVVSSIATPHYAQRGFVQASGVAGTETPRNLFGQKDGTANPRSDEEFNQYVWAGSDEGWFAGGTQLVIRRISMNLPKWDTLGIRDKEEAIGRHLDTGAPLSGGGEYDAPDFAATDNLGLALIPDFAHIRNAHSPDGSDLFLRRPISYDDGFASDGSPNAGLIFAAYAQNIERQFIPVQQRLSDFDLLNLWTTPIGSSVFAVLPGCADSGFIGETLFS
jgi:dye decolorizing peroxidase